MNNTKTSIKELRSIVNDITARYPIKGMVLAGNGRQIIANRVFTDYGVDIKLSDNYQHYTLRITEFKRGDNASQLRTVSDIYCNITRPNMLKIRDILDQAYNI